MRLQSLGLGIAAAAAALVVAGDKVSYDGFQVFRIKDVDDVDAVHEKLHDLNIVEMTCGHTDHFDLAVAPQDVEAFLQSYADAELLVKDVGAEIAVEGQPESFYSTEESDATLMARQSAIPSLSWFDAYRPYADHLKFFQDLQGAMPSNSRIFSAGTSYGGRDLYGIHLWGTGGRGKPVIYFHGTTHAREWIAAPVVEYITRELVSGFVSNDATVRGFLNKFDFYIIPFVSPDGFTYTQSNDRLWRKNRQPRSGQSCVGTDNNRNWNYQWSVSGGASTSPCSETYKGLAGGDTPEIRSLQTFTNSIRGNGIKLFIDWHSFGNYVLLPYGYSCSARAPNHSQQMTVANGHASRLLSTGGQRWTVGPSCSTLYATTGSAPDYMSGSAGAEYSWTIELRSGGSGSSGFVLPASQILPSGREQWEGLKYVFATI